MRVALNVLQSLLFGLVSGLTEILPVSAQAHRVALLKLFGAEESALLTLLLHIGTLLAILVACRGHLTRIRRERRLAALPQRRRSRPPDRATLMDRTLVRAAFLPALLGLVLYAVSGSWRGNLLAVSGLLIVNGVLLFLPSRMPAGNKDARSMSRLDSLLIGLGAAASMLPGISRTGATCSIALMRGADRGKALDWSLLLSIPLLAVCMVLDIVGIAGQGLAGWGFLAVLRAVLAAAAAFGGAYLGIMLMRFLSVKQGYSGFAYYAFGAALFLFILYLA